MSRAKNILNKFIEQEEIVKIDPTMPVDAVSIEQAFMKRMDNLGIDGVTVDQVDVDLEGDIVVHFRDENDDEMAVLFLVDPDEGVIALILDEDPDSDEIDVIDFDTLSPSVLKTNFGLYVNLIDLSWLNKSGMLTLFQAGSIDPVPPKKDLGITQDAYGHSIRAMVPVESFDEVGAKIVVRGGKRIRLAVVRRKRRKRLTTAQKIGMRKAGLARKRNKTKTSKKLKKSLKVRKRAGLKKAAKGFSKKFKVSGA